MTNSDSLRGLTRPHRSIALLICCSSLAAAFAPEPANVRAEPADPAEQERFFEEQVRPLLARRCFECHGADKQEGGLRLDSRAGVLQGGESGEPAAMTGNPQQSLLVRAIRHEGDVQMPPDFKLPDEEVRTIASWIEMGLPWGESARPSTLTITDRAAQDRQSHWAFQPIQRPAFPPVQHGEWLSTGVDYFILAKLEASGLAPSPRADRRTLIRRLAFDLHGIPPAPEDVDAFVRDPSPAAYEQLVERMLASPRYGERWGRHWLDVARYADTRGYAFGKERKFPYAYTYRDYVIQALNHDKPFNQFVLEQLAADQLPLGDDRDALAAMGFLTTGRRFNNRVDDIDDQIDVVSRGLLGLTVACARCHDHKYDVVPAEDYYSLFGVFSSSKEPDELPLIADPTQIAGYEVFKKGLDERRAELEKFQAEKLAEVVRTAREKVGDYLTRILLSSRERLLDKLPALSLDQNELRPRMLERWRDYLKKRVTAEDPLFGVWHAVSGLNDDEFKQRIVELLAQWQALPAGSEPGQINPRLLEELGKQTLTERADVAAVYGRLLKAANEQAMAAGGTDEAIGKLPADWQPLAQVIAGKDSPTSLTAEEVGGYLSRADRNRQRELEKKIESYQVSSPAAPPRAMVLNDDDRPKDAPVLQRGNPGRPGKTVPRQFLLVLAGPERQPFSHGSGRLELAREIVASENPLTRRVLANRVWMHHMEQSMVRTPSDFGVRCDPPVHPELLDYLASLLGEHDWSLKALHREIVLSSTYQQLSTAGLSADDRRLGEEVDPENRLFWRMNQRRLEFEPLRDSLLAVTGRLELEMGGRPVDLIASPFTRRRTVYGFIDRQDLPNLFRVFDFASPDQSQADRPRTTVPQQALFLMNSPFVLEQAQALAARPEVEQAATVTDRVHQYYRLVFQRAPSAAELALGEQFLQPENGPDGGSGGLSANVQYAQLLLLTNEFCYVD